MTTQPIVWTIAGSDSGGGAGIQADLKTMQGLGVYGASVITALTAQNTQGVRHIEYPSPQMITDQLAALAEDLPAVAVKLGMLGSATVVTAVSQALQRITSVKIYDPVMVATSGDALMDVESLTILREKLLPQVDLLTPNLPEAAALLNRPGIGQADIPAAAQALRALGPKAVLIKGGHAAGRFSQDYYQDDATAFWLTSPRRETRNVHGTGCTLSAAITAAMALGYPMTDAVVIAKAYVNQGLRLAPGLGAGFGPLYHGGWPTSGEDMPWVTPTGEKALSPLTFPSCGPMPLGFYPVVPTAAWVARLVALGVTTIQLRVKDLDEDILAHEIAQAVSVTRKAGCRLFINDYWEAAIRYGAYGVHLGQEDLMTADLSAIAAAGIRLGVSTHCYAEVARALAIRPSYIAIGPIHTTTTKVMRFAPQGIAALKRWRETLPDLPLVAIGGLFLENAGEALAAGADGIAVVRDILLADDVPARVLAWQTRLGQETKALTEV